jgi:hypothetical protein
MKALIVDDEADRRFWMREGLRDHGVTSQEASSVREAILRLRSSPFDLVVCDMVLTDPPEAANPALRGYLVVCFALARSNCVVVQASTLRRWFHTGAVLTNWQVDEVADVVYGSSGIPAHASADGGCPWMAIQRAAAASPDRRAAAAVELANLPIVRELEAPLGLNVQLGVLEDAAASDQAEWRAAVLGFRSVLFPGAGSAA